MRFISADSMKSWRGCNLPHDTLAYYCGRPRNNPCIIPDPNYTLNPQLIKQSVVKLRYWDFNSSHWIGASLSGASSQGISVAIITSITRPPAETVLKALKLTPHLHCSYDNPPESHGYHHKISTQKCHSSYARHSSSMQTSFVKHLTRWKSNKHLTPNRGI